MGSMAGSRDHNGTSIPNAAAKIVNARSDTTDEIRVLLDGDILSPCKQQQ